MMGSRNESKGGSGEEITPTKSTGRPLSFPSNFHDDITDSFLVSSTVKASTVFSAPSNYGNAAGTQIHNILAPVGEPLGEGLSQAARPVGNVVGSVVEPVMVLGDLANSAPQWGPKAEQGARDTAGAWIGKGKEMLGAGGRKAEEVVGQAGGSVEETAGRAGEASGNVGGEVKETSGKAGKEAEKTTGNAEETVHKQAGGK